MKQKAFSSPVSDAICCGCMACVAACPIGCIRTVVDREGFPRPRIDQERCLKCGKCLRVCPARSPYSRPRLPKTTLALRVADERTWERSSSGGAFSLLAGRTLDASGVVFGAAIDADGVVRHRFIESRSELDSLRRSKYVWSDPGRSYHQSRDFLKQGRKVLFCGTPCQISGLKSFLGDDPPNLTTVDFICHGVPSPKAWAEYLCSLAKKRGVRPDEIVDVNFREKAFLDKGPYAFSYAVRGRRFVEPASENPYLRGFACDLFLNSACHRCPVKRFRSGADCTLADFWGAHILFPEWATKSDRFSLIHVFSDKGDLSGVPSDAAVLRTIDPWKAWAFNPSWKDSPLAHPNRKRFFAECGRIDAEENIRRNAPIPLWMRIAKRMRAYQKGALRRIARLWEKVK